jgi:hypothetical protein
MPSRPAWFTQGPAVRGQSSVDRRKASLRGASVSPAIHPPQFSDAFPNCHKPPAKATYRTRPPMVPVPPHKVFALRECPRATKHMCRALRECPRAAKHMCRGTRECPRAAKDMSQDPGDHPRERPAPFSSPWEALRPPAYVSGGNGGESAFLPCFRRNARRGDTAQTALLARQSPTGRGLNWLGWQWENWARVDSNY